MFLWKIATNSLPQTLINGTSFQYHDKHTRVSEALTFFNRNVCAEVKMVEVVVGVLSKFWASKGESYAAVVVEDK